MVETAEEGQASSKSHLSMDINAELRKKDSLAVHKKRELLKTTDSLIEEAGKLN